MTDRERNLPPKADNTAHHRSRTYERPDFPYRCGRERLWTNPCGRGPNADGSCGGVSECLPTRQGDRWRCSRPIWAGGPCRHGPKPDGSCFTQRPPCRPQASSPVKRRRAGLLAAGGSIAVIAAFFATSSGILGFDRNLTIPGPLTAAHAHLIDGKRCDLCHEGHEREGLSLIKAVVEFQDMSERCGECHDFDGHGARPHNMPVSDGRTSAEIGCIACHTEHKGNDADISTLPDADCHSCHEADKRFEGFAKGSDPEHPPLPDRFGSLALSSIRFDHARHFDAHFRKPEFVDDQPVLCVTCHEPMGTTGALAIPSFERGCADCHEDGIEDQPLLLLTWPEMETMAQPGALVSSQCRINGAIDLDDFEPVSFELPDLLEAFLMDIDPDDMTAYGDAYQRLVGRLATEGVRPLADLIEAKNGDAKRLLAGLTPETVANPACRWIFNQEYEGFEPLEAGGWIAEPFGLTYRPTGHADPVLRAWLEFGGGIDHVEKPLADTFQDRLFDPEAGPGLCASCHVPSPKHGMVWTSEPQSRRHSLFVHQPHLAIENAADDKPCITCHQIAPASPDGRDYRTIGIATCQQCHGERSVGSTCATCHRYHPIVDTKS
ncbi:MAG: hypothetical protein ACR2RF_16175 [Geminicoccaceae bacterium]